MAGKPTPDGKRVTMCAKFGEAEAALVDKARGRQTRSAWLRAAALAAMDGIPQRAVSKPPPTKPAPDLELAAPDASSVGASGCKHLQSRRAKGLCMACGTYVGG